MDEMNEVNKVETVDDNSLEHHGIRGMRWGVRRYQNKDGSLTSKGRKRYGQDDDNKKKSASDILASMKKKVAEKKAAKAEKDAEKAKEEYKKKSVDKMTDEELARAIRRSQMEAQYKQLNPEPEKREGFMKQFVDKSIKPALIDAGKRQLTDLLNTVGGEAISKLFPKEKVLSPDDQQKLYNLMKDKRKDKADKWDSKLTNQKAKDAYDDYMKKRNGEKDTDSGGDSKPNTDSDSGSKSKTNSSTKNNSSTKAKVGKTRVRESNSYDEPDPDVKVSYTPLLTSGKSNTQSSSSTRTRTVYEGTWEDASTSSYISSGRSSTQSLLSSGGNRSVAGLLTDGRTSAGQSYIAGLLPAPRDRDD